MTITVQPTQEDIDNAVKNGTRLGFPKHVSLVNPEKDGKFRWRVSFKYKGARRELGVGAYPETSADLAMQRAMVIHAQVKLGLDPSEERKKAKQAHCDKNPEADASKYEIIHPMSFHAVALAWVAHREDEVGAETISIYKGRISNHLKPTIGHKLLSEITGEDLSAAFKAIRKKKDKKIYSYGSTVLRTAQMCGKIFNFGVARGYVKTNPCTSITDELPRSERRHFPAITNPAHLAKVLSKINAYHGTPVVAAALKLLPLLMVRPGNLRFALWSEFDLDLGFWIIPAEKMKASQRDKAERDPYIVPLSKQAVEILRELWKRTGTTGRVFPGQRCGAKFISGNTLNKALTTIGVCTKREQTGHGFRAVARTMLREQLLWDPDVIELQLDHVVKDDNGRAYNRTELIVERQRLMQAWGQYWEDLQHGRIAYVDPLANFTPITVSSARSATVKTPLIASASAIDISRPTSHPGAPGQFKASAANHGERPDWFKKIFNDLVENSGSCDPRLEEFLDLMVGESTHGKNACVYA